MPHKKPDYSNYGPRTRLVAAGKEFTEHGIVNPPVYHASTILYRDLETLRSGNQPYRYGRRGTPTTRALEQAVAMLEGGHGAKVCPSGMAAISTMMLAYLSAGDHILMADTVYLPARRFAQGMMRRLGIETTFIDPKIGAEDLTALIRPNTRMLYLESPGSQTFEISDVAALAEAAHERDCLVAIDNTWSGGHYFKALEQGCDISIQAGTKYLVGHSDAMIGFITTNKQAWPQLHDAYGEFGQCAGPDDLYLCLRGMRTLDVRLERHMKNALTVADWLMAQDIVDEVFYPALPSFSEHALWKRDFTGASGLFSAWLRPVSETALAAMVDHMELFGMGASWGGYESLILPFNPSAYRTATKWSREGQGIRLHVGLEDTDDLIADLKAGFDRMRKAS